jgi:Uma2 family endonuclease
MTTLSSAASLSLPATLLTAEEFATRYAHRHAELVEGVVKEYPVPFPKHGKICATISALLWTHVSQADSGHSMSNDSWIKTGSNPDTVRGADACYFSYERLPKGKIPEGLLSVAPELVVEVRSPTDRWTNIYVKIGEYLKAGVRVVVILDPGTEAVSVYRDDVFAQTLHNSDELTIPDVLPGFAVVVSRLFA